MNEYNEILNKKIIDNFVEALIIDINNDKIFKYINKGGSFIFDKEEDYVRYLNICQNFIYEDDLQTYIDSLSLAKFNDNNNHITLNYRMLNKELGTYLNYRNNISLYSENGKKIIVVLVSQDNDNKVLKDDNNSTKSDLELKYNKMIDSISLSMLKIHNAINMDQTMRPKDEYINSILFDLTNDYPELNKSFNENATEVYNSGKGNILIADDDKIICTLLSKIFKEKYNIIVANNGQEAINILKDNKNDGFNISCVFLDLMMPVVDGFTVLEYLNDNNYFNRMPVIIISGNYDRETRDRIYNYPIADMLEKPFNAEVIKHRVENLIQLYGTSSILNDMMIEQQSDLRKIINGTVMSYELDYAGLINLLKKYLKVLIIEFAKIYPDYNFNEKVIEKIVNSSVYFAMGNYILPKCIYAKKEFNSEDKKIVNAAILNSVSIIKYIISFSNNTIDSKYATEIIKYYTEKFDGTGYPEGLSGENVPISAQLVSLTINYLNLTRLIKPINFEQINAMIIKESGHKFNPKVVEAFKACQDKFAELTK